MSEWNEISQITPILFVSALSAITDDKLKELGINLVVNATKDLPCYRPQEGLDVSVIRVPVNDFVEANLMPYFKPVADLIQENGNVGGKTVVHCLCGVSRSVSLCIAFLMSYKSSEKAAKGKMNIYEGLDYVKARRSIARPNAGFVKQLVHFEKLKADEPDTCLSPDESAAIFEIREVINRTKSGKKRLSR